MLVCSPYLCGTWCIFYIGLCSKGMIRTWEKLEGLDHITPKQEKNNFYHFDGTHFGKQPFHFGKQSLLAITNKRQNDHKADHSMSKYSYNKHIFAMKIHMPVKVEAKSRQVRSYSTCHKHKFYFDLLSEWFLRWASVYLYLPWLSQEGSSKMTRSQRIITFCFACSLHFQLEPLS